MHSMLERGFTRNSLRPRKLHVDWARHIFRELNAKADELANRHTYSYYFDVDNSRWRYYRIFFDGSLTRTAAGGGWILFGANAITCDSPEEWHVVASLSFPMAVTSSITVCELEACVWSVAFLTALVVGITEAQEVLHNWRTLETSRHRVLELANLL